MCKQKGDLHKPLSKVKCTQNLLRQKIIIKGYFLSAIIMQHSIGSKNQQIEEIKCPLNELMHQSNSHR
jgi:hypothetical protein